MRDAAVGTVRRVARAATDSYVPFLAGSLAYHTFLLLVPLLLILFVVVSAVGGESGVAHLVGFTQPYLTRRARLLLAEAIAGASDRADVILVGVGALFWSLVRIFRGLDIAFATIYGVPTRDSIRGQLRDGVVTSLAVGIALLAVIAAGTIVAAVFWGPLVRVLNAALFVAVLVAAFFSFYRVFPNAEMTAREALPGAAAAALGWTAFHLAFQTYAAYALDGEVYGVFGVILSVLLWLYASMFVLLLGAVVNAVLTGRA